MMQAEGPTKLVDVTRTVGGLISFIGAIAYAELGAIKPEAGADYVYNRDAYGPLPAFLYGWTWYIVAKPASIATITSGIVRVLEGFPALDFLKHGILPINVTIFALDRDFTFTYGHLVSIAATVLISYLNYLGIKKAGQFQLIFTILKIAMIAAIVVGVFAAASGTWGNFALSF